MNFGKQKQVSASKVLEAVKYPSTEKQLIQYLHFMEY